MKVQSCIRAQESSLVFLLHGAVLSLIILFLPARIAEARPCSLNGSYVSTQLLSTLLSGNSALTVTSESTELTLRRGTINVSPEASIDSPLGAPVVFTGDAVLRGSARYRVVNRGNLQFLIISNIRRDIFTTRTFINGVLASEREMSGVVFGDKEVRFRCQGRALDLFYDIGEESKRVRYSRR